MKLYIKQKIFSLNDKYNIYDENENQVYYVTSDYFTIGAKMHFMDVNDDELFFIRRKLTFLVASYEIYKKGTLCATVNQKLSLFRGKLDINSSYGNFEIRGDFFGMNFEIYKNGSLFGSISKKWMSWGDTYELNILESENISFFCALVITIDNCLHNENNN